MKRVLSVLLIAILLTACNETNRTMNKIKNTLSVFVKSVLGRDAPNETQVNIPMVKGVSIIRDIAYGTHQKQRMDIYAPKDANNAPLIVVLHGGGWNWGDKADVQVYINKVNRWVPKGFVVASVDTRLMSDGADVYSQIDDLAHAVAHIQQHAGEWGGDVDKLMLMGHSSAGTIVSVLAAKPAIVTVLGGRKWLANFAIDSSSLDIARTMRLWAPDMFTYAYGKDPAKWLAASPFSLLSSESLPMFIACSTQRGDAPCEQAELFVDEAKKFSTKIKIVPQDLDHGAMDFNLGVDAEYTDIAESFMASLDSDIAHLLGKIGEN